jgi:hypothetical protein
MTLITLNVLNALCSNDVYYAKCRYGGCRGARDFIQVPAHQNLTKLMAPDTMTPFQSHFVHFSQIISSLFDVETF